MKKNNVFKAFAASLLALSLAACGAATSEGTPATSGSTEPEKPSVIATANPHEIREKNEVPYVVQT